MFQEKDFEDIISNYPELIEEGLILIGRQLTLYGRRMDLLFEDKFRRKLIIELKIGPIKDVHIGQVLSYEGMLLSVEDPTTRVMLVGNRVPPNIQRSLDHHGIAWREITLSHLKGFLLDKKDETFLNLLGYEEPVVIKKIPKEVREIQVQKSHAISKYSFFKGENHIASLKSSMTIYEQIKETLKSRERSIVTSTLIKDELFSKYGTKGNSIMLYDYCYNRINYGTKFEKHIFQYLESGSYKYLGENYPYTGLIYHKPQGQGKETIVGEWKNGVKELFENYKPIYGLDQSKYFIEQIFERQNTDPSVRRILFTFHEELTRYLAIQELKWYSRTHKIGFTYLCNDKKAFMAINVFQHLISVKFFTGNSKIDGLGKGIWVNKDDNQGSEPFRVVDSDSNRQAVQFALKAYEIAMNWPKQI